VVVVLVESGSWEILVSTFSGVSKRRPSSEVDDVRAPKNFLKVEKCCVCEKSFLETKNLFEKIVIYVSASVCVHIKK